MTVAVLVVLAAIWLLVLVPPLFRKRHPEPEREIGLLSSVEIRRPKSHIYLGVPGAVAAVIGLVVGAVATHSVADRLLFVTGAAMMALLLFDALPRLTSGAPLVSMGPDGIELPGTGQLRWEQLDGVCIRLAVDDKSHW